MEQMIIARIQARMRDLGTNATQVAAAAGLGKTAVRDILAGKVKTPTVETIAKIANVLACSVGFLIGEQEHPNGGGPQRFSHLNPRMQQIRAELSANPIEPGQIQEDADYLVYGTLTDPGAELRLYRMKDDHADLLDIKPGDFLTAVSSPEPGSANLVEGLLVVVRRMVRNSYLWEFNLRQVELNGEDVVLERRSSKEAEPLVITRIEGGDNMYLSAEGDLVLIDAVVVRITRDF